MTSYFPRSVNLGFKLAFVGSMALTLPSQETYYHEAVSEKRYLNVLCRGI